MTGRHTTMEECMAVLPIFEEMQRNGMPASRSYFEALSAEMWQRMSTVQRRISTEYFDGRPFNPNSTKQVATLLRRRGLVGHKRTQAGAVSTSEKSIGHLQFTDPAIHDVFEWREYEHIKDAFCQPILGKFDPANPDDIQPIRCVIRTTRIPTRRIAASDPNLLAMPVRTEEGRKVRTGFICPEGEVFGAWDYSQLEMRCMAHESRDPLMCQLFYENRDIHTETAARIFKIPLDQVDKFKHRIPAKNSGFGILYGIQGEGLLTQLRMLGIEGWTKESCQKLIGDWLDVFQGVKEYIARTAVEVAKVGYVRDYSGAYRYIPGIRHYDRKIAAEAARLAVSQRIQGLAQTMIQRAMIYLRPQIRSMQDSGLNVKWRLQVHDELLKSFTPDLWEPLDYIVRDALVNHSGIELRVPIECEGKYASRWSDLK